MLSAKCLEGDNLSVIIPIRVDTDDRIENCDAVIRYFQRNFPRCETVLVEQDAVSRTDGIAEKHPGIIRKFEENRGAFSKSRAVNSGILISTREIVCIADTDILLSPEAIRMALRKLARGARKVIIPFNQIVLDVSGDLRAQLIERADIGRLGSVRRLADVPNDARIKTRVVNGGIAIAHREMLIAEGGFNKKMVSYGWEDTEFLRRVRRLGYYTFLLPKYSLVHLDHRRGPDSVANENYSSNEAEFKRVKRMSKVELQQYAITDLCIDVSFSERRREQMRAIQRSKNRWGMTMLHHLINRVVAEVQIHGPQAFLRKAIKK